MNVGIVGTGMVGQALGAGFAAHGHQVMMGSRDPLGEKVQAWVARTGPYASAGTFTEAVQHGEIIVLATLWSGTESAIQMAGPEHFAGRIVMDITNPLVFSSDGPPTLELGHTDSGGEQIQRWLPQAHVVKVFNTIGAPHMVNPKFTDGTPDMFICGNDASAKARVSEICASFGWPTIDIGGMDGARLLEPLCILWVKYAYITGTWNHAFKLLRK